MKVVVGGPVCDRGWIWPRHRESVEAACRRANVEPFWLLVLSRDDPSMWDAIESVPNLETIVTDEPGRTYVREWHGQPYHRMVDLRSQWQRRVREMAPDFAWTCDSDVIVAEDALEIALPHLANWDAVGMLGFMDDSLDYSSMANLAGDRLVDRRYTGQTGVQEVDVVMASVLLSPKAVNVDWAWDRQGEDIGYCRNLAKAQCRRAICWDSRYDHVMVRPVDSVISEAAPMT